MILLACSEDSSSDSNDDATAELIAFEDQADAEAAEVCNAPENVWEYEAGENEEAACFFDLSVGFDSCELEVLGAEPRIARELMACIGDERKVLIACCQASGPCTYSSLETCGSGEGTACFELYTPEIENRLEACEAAAD